MGKNKHQTNHNSGSVVPVAKKPPSSEEQGKIIAKQIQANHKQLHHLQKVVKDEREKYAKLQPNKSDSPFLGRPTRITTTDGRIISGILACYDGKGNMILVRVGELRPYESKPVTRQLLSLAVPIVSVAKMQQAPHSNPSEEPKESPTAEKEATASA